MKRPQCEFHKPQKGNTVDLHYGLRFNYTFWIPRPVFVLHYILLYALCVCYCINRCFQFQMSAFIFQLKYYLCSYSLLHNLLQASWHCYFCKALKTNKNRYYIPPKCIYVIFQNDVYLKMPSYIVWDVFLFNLDFRMIYYYKCIQIVILSPRGILLPFWTSFYYYQNLLISYWEFFNCSVNVVKLITNYKGSYRVLL